ncbi:hypothetical protein N7450_007598 [Penicillium hetheringtonii]|uniref:SMP domain-containing protein n=1 Tax=Penicillium hetheringtonii TaxID=911720 RepID=A0AAD6DHY9_9EURO|nr:hypothetical protein N7450_007598 [Penicillium hetheringtonii]
MTFDIPSVSELKHAAETGQRITPADVSTISQAESELTGRGPVRGGPAGNFDPSLLKRYGSELEKLNVNVATAQSIAMRQMNFDTKVDEVSRKPSIDITQRDAREIQSTEGRAFHRAPGFGSISAQVRTIANQNEEDARETQRAESLFYGGVIPSGGMASQMQSAADKVDQARRDSL